MIAFIVSIVAMFLLYNFFFSPYARCVNTYTGFKQYSNWDPLTRQDAKVACTRLMNKN